MNISHLPPTDLVGRLGDAGLYIRTGPFVVQLRSRLPQVIEALQLLYADFRLAKSEEFADFHIEIARPRGLRRWLRPQVVVFVDGECPAAPLPLEQAVAVMEGCLNWCIYTQMHQYFIVHAAALERDGFAVILPAPPGYGKSTLCAALTYRGWRLLTDELTLISLETGAVIPLARPISLKNESIQVMSAFAPQAVFGPESPGTIKGTIAHMRPPSDSVLRANESALPGWVVFPQFKPGGAAESRQLPKAQAFMRVAESSVNYPILGAQGFELLSNVIDMTDCWEFIYGDLNAAVAWFDGLKSPSAGRCS